MDPLVFFSVLAAAAMHAGWNSVVKTRVDGFVSVTVITAMAGIISLIILPFVELPSGIVWLWLVLSLIFHTGYKLFLVRAYRLGDFGQVYPLARGAAPLMVTMVSLLFLYEGLTPRSVLGICVLVSGIWIMSLKGGQHVQRLDRATVGFAIGTSCFIAGYTLVDGLGARQAPSATSYALCLFIADALVFTIVFVARRGVPGILAIQRAWKGGLAGGVMSMGAYWIAIWAMTQAPIAAVAALRETSILFALAISTVALKERLTKWRLVAALLIVCGVVVLRL
jgi:drug/metabolite transporter (DMT)-like permease